MDRYEIRKYTIQEVSYSDSLIYNEIYITLRDCINSKTHTFLLQKYGWLINYISKDVNYPKSQNDICENKLHSEIYGLYDHEKKEFVCFNDSFRCDRFKDITDDILRQ